MAVAWTSLPDSDVDPESPITTALMQALRDNPEGIAKAASGAPTIVSGALDLSVAVPRLDTVVDATNGGANDLTNIDFTGIKSGAKRIIILFDNVSLSGSDDIVVQIGDSDGIESSGYDATAAKIINGANPSVGQATGSFAIDVGSSSARLAGMMILNVRDGTSNIWISHHSGQISGTETVQGGGRKQLSKTLDRVRIAASGSNTFNVGDVNIMVE